MSDLENVLRRLARLLAPEEAVDGARVAEDAEPKADPPRDAPADGGPRVTARNLPHRGAAAT